MKTMLKFWVMFLAATAVASAQTQTETGSSSQPVWCHERGGCWDVLIKKGPLADTIRAGADGLLYTQMQNRAGRKIRTSDIHFMWGHWFIPKDAQIDEGRVYQFMEFEGKWLETWRAKKAAQAEAASVTQPLRQNNPSMATVQTEPAGSLPLNCAGCRQAAAPAAASKASAGFSGRAVMFLCLLSAMLSMCVTILFMEMRGDNEVIKERYGKNDVPSPPSESSNRKSKPLPQSHVFVEEKDSELVVDDRKPHDFAPGDEWSPGMFEQILSRRLEKICGEEYKVTTEPHPGGKDCPKDCPPVFLIDCLEEHALQVYQALNHLRKQSKPAVALCPCGKTLHGGEIVQHFKMGCAHNTTPDHPFTSPANPAAAPVAPTNSFNSLKVTKLA